MRPVHGWRLVGVIEFGESGEEFIRAEGVFAEGVGDGEIEFSEEVQCGGPNGGHDVGGGAGADAAGIFAEGHVQHVKRFVFDLPATAEQPEEHVRDRHLPRQTGDGVGHAAGRFALTGDFAFQADELFRTGPVEIAGVDQVGRRCDGSFFHATATLLDGFRDLPPGFFLLLGVGGKSPRRGRRRCGHHDVTAAGCL